MRALAFLLVLAAAPLEDPVDEQYAYVAALAEKGLHAQVVREAQAFLEQHPQHEKADLARYRLGCALFELAREREALPVLQQLSQRGEFEFAAEVQFRLGQCLLATGAREAAEAALARVLAARKEYLAAPALALLANSELVRRDDARALSHFEALLARKDAGEYAADARCGRAWCLQHLGRTSEAADAARAAMALAPAARTGELGFLLGECLLDAHDAAGALEAYAKVAQGEFADAALRGGAFARAELGQHAEAARDFGALCERFPASRFVSECALQRGVELLRAGDARGARAALSAAPCPADPEALGWRARAEAASGDEAAALATLERALAAQPEGELAQRLALQRAELLAKSGRTAEAQRVWQSVGNDRALLAAAVAALGEQRFDDAARLSGELLQRFAASPLAAEAQLARAEAHYGAQRWKEAESDFRGALTALADPARGPRLRSRLAWCAWMGGEPARAAGLFDALAGESGDASEIEEAAFLAGRAREDAGDASGAAEAYDRARARFPAGPHRDECELRAALACPSEAGRQRLEALCARLAHGALSARAHYELAEHLVEAGRADEALPHYQLVLAEPAAGEWAARAGYGMAWAQYQSKSWDECARTLDALATRAGLDATLATAARELGVWCALRRADLGAALTGWRAWCADGPDEERAAGLLHELCAALCTAQRFDEGAQAIELAERAARTPRLRAKAALERALLFSAADRPEEAARAIEAARTQGGEEAALAEALFRLGEARYARGADAEAIPLYDAAAREKNSPVADRALYKAGFARLRAGDAAGAERCFQQLIDTCAHSELFVETLFLLGEAQFREQRFDAAIANLERVRREAPRHAVLPKALFRLGLALGERQRWKDSAAVLAELVKAQPEFPNLAEAELGRGRALGELGDARGARAALERVLALDRGVLAAQAQLELGRVEYAAGDLDAALSRFLKVAVLYEGDEVVAEGLVLAGRVLEEQRQPAQALAQYKEARDKHPKARYAAEAAKRIAELERR